jgi:NTE family protein
MSKQKIALVLSSGGARGYAHIGVIEGLESLGYQITSIAGCSMGAVIGGIYATGQLERFKRWACDLQKGDVFKLYDFIFSNQGLIKGEKIFKQMESYIPDCSIETLKIPFTAVATDLVGEKEVTFSSGSLYRALRASSAVPAVVKPVEIGGQEFLDGGVLNPLPIQHVQRTPGDLLMAVDVNAPIEPEQRIISNREVLEEQRYKNELRQLLKKWFRKDDHKWQVRSNKKLSFFEVLIKSFDMMQDRLVQETLKEISPDVLVRISRKCCGTFEYYTAREMIQIGRAALENALKIHHGVNTKG